MSLLFYNVKETPRLSAWPMTFLYRMKITIQGWFKKHRIRTKRMIGWFKCLMAPGYNNLNNRKNWHYCLVHQPRLSMDVALTGIATFALVTLLPVVKPLPDWQILPSLFLQTYTWYVLAEKKVCPLSLDLLPHNSQSNTQISPFISQRNAGKAQRERIFILTLLIRKELNLSGKSHSFFSFRHTVKSILRSDCKSYTTSLSFQGSFSLIL